MKFAGNISTLCQDIPRVTDRLIHLLKRKDYNFVGIECQNPYDHTIEEWKDVMASHGPVEWVLINSPHGFQVFPDANENPTKTEMEQKILNPAIEYATKLNVPRIHLVMKDIKDPSQIQSILDFLKFSAQKTEPLGITCLIEPLSVRPEYYLRSYHDAMRIVDQLKCPNLKVMLDTYHLQKLHGNLTENIKSLIPYTGHIQISQVPERNSPVLTGEINYAYLLKQISKFHQDFVGLEYFSETSESFSWLKDFEDV